MKFREDQIPFSSRQTPKVFKYDYITMSSTTIFCITEHSISEVHRYSSGYFLITQAINFRVLLGLYDLSIHWPQSPVCIPLRISDYQEMDSGRFCAKTKEIWMSRKTLIWVSGMADRKIEKEGRKLKRITGNWMVIQLSDSAQNRRWEPSQSWCQTSVISWFGMQWKWPYDTNARQVNPLSLIQWKKCCHASGRSLPTTTASKWDDLEIRECPDRFWANILRKWNMKYHGAHWTNCLIDMLFLIATLSRDFVSRNKKNNESSARHGPMQVWDCFQRSPTIGCDWIFAAEIVIYLNFVQAKSIQLAVSCIISSPKVHGLKKTRISRTEAFARELNWESNESQIDPDPSRVSALTNFNHRNLSVFGIPTAAGRHQNLGDLFCISVSGDSDSEMEIGPESRISFISQTLPDIRFSASECLPAHRSWGFGS
jgi:hypothetical protein